MKSKDRLELLQTLHSRFETNMDRHRGVAWDAVLKRLEASSTALESLAQMEATGGEPDVIGPANKSKQIVYCDCSLESPAGRRSLCYDGEALRSRKENKPAGNVVDMARTMGIELLTEEHYRALQQFGDFDTKTSSWIATPQDIRELGGAIFGDRRYGRVFVYHNGAQSYYAARGFRGRLLI